MTFVASATASSSRSDDDAMSVTSWRRSDNEIDAVPPPPFGLMGVAGDLCVAPKLHQQTSWYFMGRDTRVRGQAPNSPSMFIHATRHSR